MIVRKAKQNDLYELKILFNDIVSNMIKCGITFWNEYYPYEEFPTDIKNKNLYLLTNNKVIIGVFVLTDSNLCKDSLKWSNIDEKAIYLMRVGVNVNFLRQGIGAEIINQSKKIAICKGAKYLRLLVVDSNYPAINLYKKQGFKQVDGINREYIEERNETINELGFEIKI